jgi:CCR4-NOT transcription complex subunit 6
LVDGCAVFYKRAKYTLVEQHILEFKSAVIHIEHLRKSEDTFNRVHNRDHIAVICCFESKESGSRFIVANTHLFWDAAYSDVKLVQTGLLIEKLQEVSDTFASYPVRRTEPGSRPPPSYSDGSRIPLVLCGDFNSMHGSGVYEFLSNGYVSPSHPDWLNRRYGLFTEEGMRHRLGLKNSYANVELGMTNYTPGFQGVLDYIWYGGQNLALNAVLAEVDKGYLEKVIGFPNSAFPSDHICLAAEFRVKPPRDTQRSFDA